MLMDEESNVGIDYGLLGKILLSKVEMTCYSCCSSRAARDVLVTSTVHS